MAMFHSTVLLGGKTATGIPVPENVVLGLDAGKRVAIVVTIGDHSYRSSVAPYRGEYMIPLSAENREAAGVSAGDEVEVTIEVDSTPREVDIPADLALAFEADAAARAAFAALSYSNQRQHVLAIEGAKAPETRARRVQKTITLLRGES